MSDYLPRDLLFSIFERMQIKQLGKCMVVCKTWSSIITSPEYITQNLNTVNKTQALAWNKRAAGNEYNDLALKHVLENHRFYMTMVGIVNGLICFSMKFFPCDPVIILWNPSIDKFLRLPEPNMTFGQHSFRFGFDAATGDFKLVRISSETKMISSELLIEVFKLSTGKWNTKNGVNLPYELDLNLSYNSYASGNLHWVGYGKEKDAILAFDLRTEEFREMILPNSLFIPGKIKSVDVCNGSLTLVNFFEGEGNDYLGIWIMERYGDATSWTRVYQRSHSHALYQEDDSLRSGVKYKSLVINRQISVSVDEMNKGVILKRVCYPGLQRALPRTKLEISLCQSLEFEDFECNCSHTGPYFESLALFDHKEAREKCGRNLFGCVSYLLDTLPVRFRSFLRCFLF